MNYNTNLQSNNTSLEEILETIKNLPEAGGSENENIETCSVTIQCAGTSHFLYLTVDSSGKIYQGYVSGTKCNETVLCTSQVAIIGNTMYSTSGALSMNNAELIVQKNYGAIFKITAGANENATITVISMDT